MKRWIKNNTFRSLALLLLAVILVTGASIRSAWAYFTTYATAKGGYPIALGEETQMEEDFAAWQKTVTIRNEENSSAVYVRARAMAGDTFTLTYSDSSGKWSPGEDGWYYYSDTLAPGAETEALVVTIGNVPADVEPGMDAFNVIVVYESSGVLYRADGTPYYDWKQVADTGEGGENGYE